MGNACRRLHENHGTKVRCPVGVEAIEGSGQVERVRLSDGSAIPADVVVVGVGVVPNVGWLGDSGLTIDNGLVCDEYLNAGHPAVYAAGDLVRWPNGLFGKSMRCEHWTNSGEQGRTAARNLLAGNGGRKPFKSSCYFWSDQYGSRIQFVGMPIGEAAIVHGSIEDNKFIALYRDADSVVGAMGLNSPKSLMKVKVLIERQTSSWDTVVTAVSK
jgi:NADPH-dependent 2,4-dienoyl-CoA reductase/sulfur reductase-like enzyme